MEGPLPSVFYVDRNSKMTATAGHSFYIGSFYNQVNDTGSWEPLVCLLLTFRVLYFESFDFASSSLTVVSSSVLDTLSNLFCHLFVSFSNFTLSEENLAIAFLWFNWNWFITFKEVVIKLSKLSIWMFNSFILFYLSSMPLFNETFSFLTSLTTSCIYI